MTKKERVNAQNRNRKYICTLPAAQSTVLIVMTRRVPKDLQVLNKLAMPELLLTCAYIPSVGLLASSLLRAETKSCQGLHYLRLNCVQVLKTSGYRHHCSGTNQLRNHFSRTLIFVLLLIFSLESTLFATTK